MDTSIFMPYIDVEDGLKRLMNSKALYLKLANSFVGTAAGLMDEIDAAIASSNTAVALDRVHTLKGAAANLSYKQMFEDCVALEADLKGTGTEVASLHSALKSSYSFSMDMTTLLIPELEG